MGKTSLLLVVVLTLLSITLPQFGAIAFLAALILWVGIVVLIMRNLHQHTHDEFGSANRVTTLRAASTAVLAGLVPVSATLTSTWGLWAIAVFATVTLIMDGLDGYLARKSGLASPFGARFDMETDALLALVITLFLWQSGKSGIWVLALGMMRYAFLFASIWLAPLKADLYPSMRRKTICVVQVGALCLMLCPWLSSAQATLVGGIALLCLIYSFTTDILWLYRHHSNLQLFTKLQKQK